MRSQYRFLLWKTFQATPNRFCVKVKPKPFVSHHLSPPKWKVLYPTHRQYWLAGHQDAHRCTQSSCPGLIPIGPGRWVAEGSHLQRAAVCTKTINRQTSLNSNARFLFRTYAACSQLWPSVFQCPPSPLRRPAFWCPQLPTASSSWSHRASLATQTHSGLAPSLQGAIQDGITIIVNLIL